MANLRNVARWSSERSLLSVAVASILAVVVLTPWLDLARFVSFAWAGVLLSVATLRVSFRVVADRLGEIAAWALVLGAAAVSGAGVAIGRFGRVNSWDMLTRPTEVISATTRLASSSQAIGVAGFFTLLVLVTVPFFEAKW